MNRNFIDEVNRHKPKQYMKNNIDYKLLPGKENLSTELIKKEFFEFSTLKRKIKKWLVDQNPKRVIPIVNHFVGISNTFTKNFILETVDEKYTHEECKIIHTLFGMDEQNHIFRNMWIVEMKRLRG